MSPRDLIDYYKILQVSRFADDFVIKAAYRVLASHYHPDKNPNIFDKDNNMQLINDAYATLIDPVKRAVYDELLQSNAKMDSSNSDQMSSEYSAGKVIGRMIVRELFKKSG